MEGAMKESDALILERLFMKVIDEGDEGELFVSRSREGVFSPALVMWLSIASRIEGRGDLMSALDQLSNGMADEVLRRNTRSERASVSRSNSGLCRARQRLSLNLVERVCELVSDAAMKQVSEHQRWNGKRVYIADGTTVTLARSQRTQEKYEPVKNQSPRASHTSQMVCSCIHDRFSGVALSPALGPYRGKGAIGETGLCKKMLARLPEAGVFIGDRAFGIFSIAYAADTAGHKVLVRLTSKREAAVLGRKPSHSEIDEAVIWKAGSTKNSPEIIPNSTLKGRFIKRTIRQKGFRDVVISFFTTLSEPVEEILSLYMQRESIENDIRSLKCSLDLEMLHAQTPEVLEKEVLLGFAAYNLVRSIIVAAAKKLQLPPRKISFTRAASLSKIFGRKLLRASPSETVKIIDDFTTALYQTRHPNRSRRRLEPRKIIRIKQSYDLMKKSRDEERRLAITEGTKRNWH